MPFDTREANRNKGAPRMKLVAGNSNRPLAEAIAGTLNLSLRSIADNQTELEKAIASGNATTLTVTPAAKSYLNCALP